MLLTIERLLNPAQLDKLHELLGEAEFIDGKLSAGFAAARVKHNQEARLNERRMALAARILMSSLGHNAIFRSAALPHRVADPIFARYQSGMAYGAHIDDPILGEGAPRLRSDVSLTVFLNPPGDYDGGELRIRTSFGEVNVKGEAGDATLYPSSSLHQVMPVTRGERLVAVTWIQSYVRDPARRELLYDLATAREALLREAPEADATALTDRAYVNLVRMWSEL